MCVPSQAVRRTLAACFFTAFGVLTAQPAQAVEPSTPTLNVNRVYSTSMLREIEQRVLPPTLKPGTHQQEDLPAFYRAANPQLQQRFEAGRRAFESSDSNAYRCVTLVAGSAGIGKTFIKKDIFSKSYPKEAICKFDLRELYQEWQQSGLTEVRPDLQSNGIVLSRMLAQKDLASKQLTAYLQAQSASFYVIDSLDEIHPDDYQSLLNEIEAFALDGNRSFIHVVVLGRHLAFRDYWRGEKGTRPADQMSLFVLHAPEFRTTGDLLVSSWNYHTWQHGLAWAPSGGEPDSMSLADYQRWGSAGYPLNGDFRSVSFSPNQSMDQRVQGTLTDWASQQPVVASMLYNLAGNAMIREICERCVATGTDYDERAVMEAYLAAWLRRETGSEGRPSIDSPEHLDLYLHLLEHVATKYLAEGKVGSDGFFHVSGDDVVTLDYRGQRLSFAADRILNRSGLKAIDFSDDSLRRYRFEPLWYHRLLVERHNERIRRQDLALRQTVGEDS